MTTCRAPGTLKLLEKLKERVKKKKSSSQTFHFSKQKQNDIERRELLILRPVVFSTKVRLGYRWERKKVTTMPFSHVKCSPKAQKGFVIKIYHVYSRQHQQ